MAHNGLFFSVLGTFTSSLCAMLYLYIGGERLVSPAHLAASLLPPRHRRQNQSSTCFDSILDSSISCHCPGASMTGEWRENLAVVYFISIPEITESLRPSCADRTESGRCWYFPRRSFSSRVKETEGRKTQWTASLNQINWTLMELLADANEIH